MVDPDDPMGFGEQDSTHAGIDKDDPMGFGKQDTTPAESAHRPQLTDMMKPGEEAYAYDTDELGRPLTPEIKQAEKDTLPAKLGILSMAIPGASSVQAARLLGGGKVAQIAAPTVAAMSRVGANAISGGIADAANTVAKGGNTADVEAAAEHGATIGGLTSLGIESAIKGGSLIFQGGRWIKNAAADALFNNDLSQKVLDNPKVQEAINKVASFKGALGWGKNFKDRVGDIAEEATKTHTTAVGKISNEPIPISEVLPEDTLAKLDVDPLNNELRSKLTSVKKNILTNLEPIPLKLEREAKISAIEQSILEKKSMGAAEKSRLLSELKTLKAGIQEESAAATLAEKEARRQAMAKYLEEKASANITNKKQLQEIKAIKEANRLGSKQPILKPANEEELAAELAGKRADIEGELAARKSEIAQRASLAPAQTEVTATKQIIDNSPKPNSIEVTELESRLQDALDLESNARARLFEQESRIQNAPTDEIRKQVSRNIGNNRDTHLAYLENVKETQRLLDAAKQKVGRTGTSTTPAPIPQADVSPVDNLQTLQDEYQLAEALGNMEHRSNTEAFEQALPTARAKDMAAIEQAKFVPQDIPEFVPTRVEKPVFQTIPSANIKSPLEGQLNSQIANVDRNTAEEVAGLQAAQETIEPQTTLREAYNVANTPINDEVNILAEPLGNKVRELGGESVVEAEAARANMEVMGGLHDAAKNNPSPLRNIANTALRWGARASALSHPMIWLTAEVATNPELRYIIGGGVEYLGKWAPAIENAYRTGGAAALNSLVYTLNQTDPEFRKVKAEQNKLSISPYQEGAEKPRAKRTELKQEDFLKGLGNVESNGDHKALNKDSSATGKYQFLWNDNNQKLLNNWAGFPVSRDMFLRKPKLQDSFMRYVDETQLTPQAMNLQKMEPNAANRSLSELKALIHFKGPEGARRYIAEGADLTKDNNMDIEKYLNKVYGE
jgi:hypothetical protein